MNVVLNLYIVFLSFLLGIVIGFMYKWLIDHHYEPFIIIFIIVVIGFVVDGMMSIFNLDTILLQVFSELQGWVDFVSGFAGAMLGFFLEERYERKRGNNETRN